jgi:RHS repeat-associated protein
MVFFFSVESHAVNGKSVSFEGQVDGLWSCFFGESGVFGLMCFWVAGALEVHYYPFGMEMATLSKSGDPEYNFIYNQGTGDKQFKTERERSFGLNWDFTKFRTYDPTLGRFLQVDPLAEADIQYNQSPYQYTWNNPIRYSDAWGDCPEGVDCKKEKTTSYTVGFSFTLGLQGQLKVANIIDLDINFGSVEIYKEEAKFVVDGDVSLDDFQSEVKLGHVSMKNGGKPTTDNPVERESSAGVYILGRGAKYGEKKDVAEDGSTDNHRELNEVGGDLGIIDALFTTVTKEENLDTQTTTIKETTGFNWAFKALLGIETKLVREDEIKETH